MNKLQLREFAITSRVALIESVKLRAYAYGVTEDKVKENQITPSARQLNPSGGLLTNEERVQRDELLRQIEHKGFAQVMEEAAYTWFNRFIAMRYMEVAQLLPIRQRVFVRKDEVRPELIADALNVEIAGLDRARVIALIENNEDERLYKMQLIALANSLHKVLPLMFEEIDNYTELLFPDGLLQKESVLSKMAGLSEDNWQDIEVVGWLYQYYNTELNEQVYDGSMSKARITKNLLPAATTIYTPNWAVQYMMQNSLGRLWLEGHENPALQIGWKYYLPEAEQDEQVAEKLKELRKDAANLRPEEITVLDPCMGSGHILVVAFDVLMGIYCSVGYTDRDAVRSIIENNLYGLDIDDRAAQLAYFAVMMKACHYDKRFLCRENVPQPHVCAIQESNRLAEFDNLQGQMSLDKLCLNTANELIRTFHDAKEYGSILDVQIDGLENAAALMAQLRAIERPDFALSMWLQRAEKLLPQLAMQAEIMQRKYDVVVTNPPYLGSNRFSDKLDKYVKSEFPDVKSDLSMVMYTHALKKYAGHNRFVAFITTSSWMFLSSFEKIRSYVFSHAAIDSLVDYGTELFDGKVGHNPIVAWVTRTSAVHGKMTAIRLVDFCYSRRNEKEHEFFNPQNRYTACQDNFAKIPGAPVAYWVSNQLFCTFQTSHNLDYYATPRQGLITGDNERFLRFWHEVSATKTAFSQNATKKWTPINKGGEYRRWYGNQEYVVNWENNGKEILCFKDEKGKLRSRPQNLSYNFIESISWSLVTSGGFSVRYFPSCFMFNVAGIGCFAKDNLLYILGVLNTKITSTIVQILNPTINMNAGDVAKMPIVIDSMEKDRVEKIVIEAMRLSRADWDSFETSWDFQRHPLCRIDHKGIETLFGMKINKQIWIKKLRDGSACFSPVNDFIIEGEKTGNNEQGDKYEGVFARLHKNDERINEMRSRLGNDLEELCDGEHILLRRLSCRTIPVFCMYGFYKEDAEIVSQRDLPDGSIECRLRFNPSKSMFDKFLNGNTSNDNQEIAYGMGFSVGHMQSAIHESIAHREKRTLDVRVLYDLDYTSEFFIEPTSEYPELQHKAQRLSYQKEIRFILLDEHRYNKYVLPYEPLSDRSAGLFEGETYYECDVVGHTKDAALLSYIFSQWKSECKVRFTRLKANEEELNRIFIDIYGLQDELTPEIADKDVTVRRADLARDIRSLISYAVGCMMGRYSLSTPGLAYAGGDISEQWTVIGGQYYWNEVVDQYGCRKLSGFDSVAKGNGLDSGSVQVGKIAPQRGDVCAVGSDAKSGCVDPVQHCGGTGSKFQEGVPAIPVYSAGLQGGNPDADFDLRKAQVSGQDTNKSCPYADGRSRENAVCPEAGTDHCPLTTAHFGADKDGILPIADDEYFDDDIVNRFVRFVEVVYGKDTLEENLRFIADALGGEGKPPKDVLRAYFLNDFYKDHLKVYQKRPIYWLFDSGKQNGFKALVYLHRYDRDTLARMRTDYVHPQQERLRTQMDGENHAALTGDARRKAVAAKRLDKLQKQLIELSKFEEQLHHLADERIPLDLDDGVKVNYAKMGVLVQPIK